MTVRSQGILTQMSIAEMNCDLLALAPTRSCFLWERHIYAHRTFNGIFGKSQLEKIIRINSDRIS